MSNKMDSGKILMVDGGFHDSVSSELNYKELFFKYILRKWPYYLLSLMIFVGGAYFYVKTQQPVYEITSKILIKEKQEDYSNEKDWVKQNLNFNVISENITNEIEVLSSFSLIKEVVDELGLDVRYYWKDQLISYDAYDDFPVVVDTFFLNPVEDPDFEIILLDEQSFQMKKEDFAETYRYGKTFTNEFGTFKISKNKGPVALREDMTMHITFLNSKEVTEWILDSYAVEFSDLQMQSSILRLTLQDPVPKRGEDILTRVIEKYNRKKFEENNEMAVKTLEFIDERLSDISRDLANVESSLEQFKTNNNIALETSTDLDILLQNVNVLSKEQNDIQVQINILESMKEELASQEDDEYELIPVNLSLVNGQVQELVKPYNDLVLRRKQLLLTGQPSNPIIQSVNQDLSSLRASIYDALDNMKKELEFQLETKKNSYEEYAQKLKSVPRKERQLSDKSRKQSIAEDLYVYLLQKKEETTLALVDSYSNSNIIDPPRSTTDPVAPKKMVFMFGGLLAGFMLPLFLIIGVDYLRDSILTEKDLKMLIPGVNIMGTITYYKGKEQQVVLRKRGNITSEHFRSLRTKLQFHYRNKQKCIMVTSSVSTEGKTFVATNLAMSFALGKKKTIILDFDLHRPDMSRFFEDSSEMGLSDYLMEDATLKDVIQSSKLAPNLDYITSGPITPNPSELLTEEKLNILFEQLKSTYEVIIVDTPPIGLISDAIVLNKYVTNSLFVVRSGTTKKEMLEKAKEFFDKKLVTNPSIVLNGVKKGHTYGYKYNNYKKYAS